MARDESYSGECAEHDSRENHRESERYRPLVPSGSTLSHRVIHLLCARTPASMSIFSIFPHRLQSIANIGRFMKNRVPMYTRGRPQEVTVKSRVAC